MEQIDGTTPDVREALETIQSVTWPDTMPHPPNYRDAPMTHDEVAAIIHRAIEKVCYGYAALQLNAAFLDFENGDHIGVYLSKLRVRIAVMMKLSEAPINHETVEEGR